jgi:hypothetical protein
MSNLKSLTFAALPNADNSPLAFRRRRLIEKLEEQKSLVSDPSYVRVVRRWKKQNGERVMSERKLPVRRWWRTDETGQAFFFIRHGYKPVELEKGKAGILVGSREQLPGVIDVLIEAARSGELDQMLEQAKTVRPEPKKKKVS